MLSNKGWGGWMASPTQRTWIWVNSESWWWTGRPGMLQSMGLQRVGHDWATELNWSNFVYMLFHICEVTGTCGIPRPKTLSFWGDEKGVTEDEMVGWHHLLNGHEFEQTPGDGEGHLAWWRTSGVLQSMGSQSQTRLSAQNVVSSNKKQTT